MPLQQEPLGGIDARKYAALCLALAMARGALYQAVFGELEGAKRILDLTATESIAKALGHTEGELAVDWNEYLSSDEVNRIKGFWVSRSCFGASSRVASAISSSSASSAASRSRSR